MAISTKKIAGDDSVHYVSPRKKRPRAKPKMQPPLTPMIDVTFQLLLFFILTFTFKQSEGLIPGTLPQGDISNAPPAVDKPIYIMVKFASGEPKTPVYEIPGMSRRITQPGELYDYLMGQKQIAERAVVVQPWANVRWEHVVNAFNQAVRAEYKKIGFAMRM